MSFCTYRSDVSIKFAQTVNIYRDWQRNASTAPNSMLQCIRFRYWKSINDIQWMYVAAFSNTIPFKWIWNYFEVKKKTERFSYSYGCGDGVWVRIPANQTTTATDWKNVIKMLSAENVMWLIHDRLADEAVSASVSFHFGFYTVNVVNFTNTKTENKMNKMGSMRVRWNIHTSSWICSVSRMRECVCVCAVTVSACVWASIQKRISFFVDLCDIVSKITTHKPTNEQTTERTSGRSCIHHTAYMDNCKRTK